ncbi:MAG: inositol oxygenase family protein [Chloroherpetonaceae bacterium]|nr:inositol oxygenase [Chthonomonadaceae bacterium]MDW8207882.1 inositol oxygenase family protein [Chloroherpetonaceae bacterium]
MSTDSSPLKDLDVLDAERQERYALSDREAITTDKPREAFRSYSRAEDDPVRAFYRLHHRYQTLDFVKAKKREYLTRDRRRMGIWEAMEFLNTLVDESDPDTGLSQIEHLLQTAEAIRKDGHPRWFILTGLLHDLGKILCLFGEPQWAVVGDTFVTGCAYPDSIVYAEFLRENPDSNVPAYQTLCGIYEPHCGLDNVHLTWGHDEYLYHVVRDYLPEPALAMIRYHSFYPWHREGAYTHLMDAQDAERLRWVQAFNPYDLYSKSAVRPDVAQLRPYYEDLIAEYFPPVLRW